MTPESTSKRPRTGAQPSSIWLGLQLAWELGFMIALPAVVLGFGGAYLDRWAGTSPLFVISGFAAAFALSMTGVYRKMKEIERRQREESSLTDPHGIHH